MIAGALGRVRCHIACAVLASSLLLGACGAGSGGHIVRLDQSEPKTLNLFLWSPHGSPTGTGGEARVDSFLAPDAIRRFEASSGIKVNVVNYQDDAELTRTLMSGGTVDLAIPSNATYQQHLAAGLYRPIDRRLLPNLAHIDAALARQIAVDPAAADHTIVHMWGTIGIAYDAARVQAIMPDAPIGSWALVFDPAVVKRLSACGVSLHLPPSELLAVALAGAGKDINSNDPADWRAARGALMRIKDSGAVASTDPAAPNMLGGKVCVAVTYSVDALDARREASSGRRRIGFGIPKEGSVIWADSYVIPKKAAHPRNAHAFIDFMLRPDSAAATTNALHYPSGSAGGRDLVAPALRSDPAVYPPAAAMGRLVPIESSSPERERAAVALWSDFSRP